jgi:uncharacterized membrane protein YfcA
MWTGSTRPSIVPRSDVMFTPLMVVLTGLVGVLAGLVGTLLGLGGGVFLVPLLVLVLQVPFKTAAAVSLGSVIATSSAVSAGRAGRQLINLRLGMVLEVATAAGGLAGGLTAQTLSPRTLQRLFAAAAAAIGIVTLTRLRRTNVLTGPDADPGRLGGRYEDEVLGHTVTYRVRRLPLALAVSFVAGNISSLLGVGGGFVKVPVLNAWCGVPLRAAAATSAFMIGVTATSGAVIYYGHGNMDPVLTAAAVVGVQLGSTIGLRLASRARASWLKVLLALVLFTISGLMMIRAR